MKKENVYLAIIIILGIFLRFFELGTRPFDGDEGLSVLMASSNWHDLFNRVAMDVQPPFYNVLLKLFISNSINEWTVRILSAIVGMILIYLIYIFTKKILNKKIALIAVFTTTISAYLIYPSQEARMYSLLVLLSLLSYYYFYNLIKCRDFKYIIGYIIFSTLCIYTHYLGFILITSQILYLFIFERKQTDRWKTWLAGYLSIAILFLPQLSTFISQFTARANEESHALSLNNIKGVFGVLYRFGAGRLILDINPSSLRTMLLSNPLLLFAFVFSFIIPLFLFVLGIYQLHKKNKQLVWFILFPIIMAIILTIVSTEVGARASRYLIYVYPFYLIFISYAIFVYWKKWWGKVIITIFIFINLAGLFAYFHHDIKSPGINTVAQFLNKNFQENDIVLIRGSFGGGDSWALNYYWDELENDKQLKIYDIFAIYSHGKLAELRAIDPQVKSSELLGKYIKVWFFDFTYNNYNINGITHNLGKDKEGKDLILWEINK